MKMGMTALAVVLLAGMAAPAMAQPRGERSERFDHRDRPQRDGDAGRPSPAREPAAAPVAPRAAEPRHGLAGKAIAEAERRRERLQGAGRNDGGVRNDPVGRDRRGDDDRRGDSDRRGDNDRRGWDRRDGDNRDWDRRGDRGGNDGRHYDRDRHDGDRRDWDRRGDHRRWERGRYPPVYSSANRYRHAWRPPVGFYVRSWSYGDVLPRSWLGPSYWIGDPWQFDLPLPPPGFAWVRSGDDALLVDEYSGRVIQVVRDIFW